MRLAKPQRGRGGASRATALAAVCVLLIAAGCGNGDEEPVEEPVDEEPVEEPVEEEPLEEEPVEEEPLEEDPAEGEEEPEAAQAECDTESLVVGGSGSGGGAFIAGGTMAEWVSTAAEDLENMTLTNQSTGGFVENIRLLATGELDLGMVSTNLMSNAVNQTGPFEAGATPGVENIRILFPIWPQYNVIGTFNPDIQTVADLEGRPVNVGPGGSATQAATTALLSGAGILDTIDQDQQDWSEGVRLMQDGLVDAFGIMGPGPFPAIQEAAATPGEDFHLIDTTEAAADALEASPEFVPQTVPVDVHGPGLPPEEMETIGAQAYLATTSDLSEGCVNALVTSLFSQEGRDYLTNGYAGFNFENAPAFDSLEVLAGNDVVVPLHPGAVTYWEEQGETVPDVLMP